METVQTDKKVKDIRKFTTEKDLKAWAGVTNEQFLKVVEKIYAQGMEVNGSSNSMALLIELGKRKFGKYFTIDASTIHGYRLRMIDSPKEAVKGLFVLDGYNRIVEQDL